MTDQEKDLIILEQKIIALHSRLDIHEKETSKKLEDIAKDIKDILGHQNRSKGWAAAFVFLGTLFGGVIAKMFFN